MNALPQIVMHDSIYVVRDDLYPGGTKARFLLPWLEQSREKEFVYASPSEGGAQTALAMVGSMVGKQVTIFIAKRKLMHPRAILAESLGAKIIQVPYGYLNVVQSRARSYCEETGAYLLPFGMDTPEAIRIITIAAKTITFIPDEFWCAAGSGVLFRALSLAWPTAVGHAVQIGRKLSEDDAPAAIIHEYPKKFNQYSNFEAPFPSDPHYDAKAWELCRQLRGAGKILFWNVTGPAR